MHDTKRVESKKHVRRGVPRDTLALILMCSLLLVCSTVAVSWVPIPADCNSACGPIDTDTCVGNSNPVECAPCSVPGPCTQKIGRDYKNVFFREAESGSSKTITAKIVCVTLYHCDKGPIQIIRACAGWPLNDCVLDTTSACFACVPTPGTDIEADDCTDLGCYE